MNSDLEQEVGREGAAGAAAAYIECRNSGNLGKGGQPSIIVVASSNVDSLKSCIDLTGRFHPSVYERFHGDFQATQKEHYKASKSVYHALNMSEMTRTVKPMPMNL